MAFSVFDKDGDGTITTKEMGEVLKNMGHNPSESDLEEMLKEVDADGNGEIDFDEFLTMMANKMQYKENEDEILDAFKEFDNGHGFVSVKELRDVLTTLGDKMTDKEFEEMMSEATITKDGLIQIEEFVSVICR